jgi:hypothetical protein
MGQGGAASSVTGLGPWDDGSYFSANFTTNQAHLGTVYAPPASLSGWSFSRASQAYALTSAGVLTSFASGVPRITDRGLLVEASRTNLCLQSQTLDNASWSKNRCTSSADAVAAPDGTTTADKIIEDGTATNTHGVSQAISFTSGTTYTYSVYLKAAERTWGYIQLPATAFTTGIFAYFNLSTGAVGTTGGSPTTAVQQLANGWWRVSIQSAATVTTSGSVQVLLANGDGGVTYSGDSASGAYVWGAQLEAAAGASSYIATTTASVTRAADVASIPLVLSAPYTLFARYRLAVMTGAVRAVMQLDDGSAANRTLVYASSTDIATYQVDSGSVNQAALTIGSAQTLNALEKTAGVTAANDVRAYLNNAAGTPDTSVTVPAASTTLRLAGNHAGTQSGFMYLEQIAVYPVSKSNAELSALTA